MSFVMVLVASAIAVRGNIDQQAQIQNDAGPSTSGSLSYIRVLGESGDCCVPAGGAWSLFAGFLAVWRGVLCDCRPKYVAVVASGGGWWRCRLRPDAGGSGRFLCWLVASPKARSAHAVPVPHLPPGCSR